MSPRIPVLASRIVPLLLAIGLAGCWWNDEPAPERSPAERAADRGSPEAPEIRIYMSEYREFGEVVGVTAASDEFIDLSLRLENPDGNAIPESRLEIRSLVGNDLSETDPRTDADGWAELRIRPRLPGEDVLTVTGGGISRQVSLYITDEAYGHPLEHLEERVVELPEVDGVVSWNTMTDIDTREGRNGLLAPVFSDKARELDGRRVRVQGFMLPLDNSEKQSHFLLSRTPPSCFYCLPGGPENVVEVKTGEPVAFSFDPIVIDGRMELLEDSDLGLFYRLSAARLER